MLLKSVSNVSFLKLGRLSRNFSSLFLNIENIVMLCKNGNVNKLLLLLLLLSAWCSDKYNTLPTDLQAPLCDPATKVSGKNQRIFRIFSQHKGRRTASHFNDVNAKVKKLMRKTSQSVKCKVSPLLAKLLLLYDISELPSIR